MKHPLKYGVAGAFVALALSACGSTKVETAPPELVGDWTGGADVIVTWCEQERLAIELSVAPDASVSGRVGDATLVDAALRRNRGAVGRALELATDWIVEGDLDGPLVVAEAIERDGVKMPVNLRDGRIVGGLHSSGSKLGGKDAMILSATRLELTRR